MGYLADPSIPTEQTLEAGDVPVFAKLFRIHQTSNRKVRSAARMLDGIEAYSSMPSLEPRRA